MSAIRTERPLKCSYHREFFFIFAKTTFRNSVITDINMEKNRSEPQDTTRAWSKLHDAIVSGQSLKSLHKSDVSLNFIRQDVISGLWFTEKVKVITLSIQSSD